MSKSQKSATCIQCSANFSVKPNTTGLFCSMECSAKSTSEKLKNRAENIRQNAEQEYLKNPKLCANCMEIIPFEKKVNKFCSRSCSATIGNSGRKRTEESKIKTSNVLKERIANGEIPPRPVKMGKETSNYKHGKCVKGAPRPKRQKIERLPKITYRKTEQRYCIICNNPTVGNRKTCSSECLSSCRSDSSSSNLLKNRDKYKGNSGRSWMEQSFHDWLLEHNIPNDSSGFLEEQHFTHEYQGKIKHAWVDFLFPQLMLIIELDGTHHRKRKDLDDIRDKHLTEVEGYTVVRISYNDYKRGKRVDEIKKLLSI